MAPAGAGCSRRDCAAGRRQARPADGAAAGCLAAIGPAVPLAHANRSLRWARQALALAQRGLARGADGIVRCDEQLATLVLLADADLAGLLSGQALAPLRRLRPEQADRLAATLLAWLESADNAEIAARQPARPPADRPVPAAPAHRTVRRQAQRSRRALHPPGRAPDPPAGPRRLIAGIRRGPKPPARRARRPGSWRPA